MGEEQFPGPLEGGVQRLTAGPGPDCPADGGRTVWTRTGGEALNPALERTGKLLFAHSVLFAAGFALPTLL